VTVSVIQKMTGSMGQLVLNVNHTEKAHLGIVLKAKQIMK